MKSKHRSWIRRKARDLEAAFPARIDWRWHAQVDDLAPISRQIEEVAARTYQRGLDAGFKDNVFHRERLALFARQGRPADHDIGNRPAAGRLLVWQLSTAGFSIRRQQAFYPS